jgi:hypothetical protein
MMMFVLFFWITVVLVADNRNMMMSAEATTAATVVSFGTGDYDSLSASPRPTTNHLHWTFRIVTHHQKALPDDCQIVEDAIEDLLTRTIDGDWDFFGMEGPCDSVQQQLRPRASCFSISGLVLTTGDLDPLGPALVELLAELPVENGGKFNVTWVVLPQPPNVAEYTYDVMDNGSSDDNNNKTINDAVDLVGFDLFQAVEDAGIHVDDGQFCSFSLCHDDADTDDDSSSHDDDDDEPPADVTCYHVDCFLYTVERDVGHQVRTVIQQTIQLVNDQYDWFNVTFVPLDDDNPLKQVGTNKHDVASTSPFLELSPDNIMPR